MDVEMMYEYQDAVRYAKLGSPTKGKAEIDALVARIIRLEQAEIDKRDKRIKKLQGTCDDWQRIHKEVLEMIFRTLDEAFGKFLGKRVVYQNLKSELLKGK